ncbi:ATP-dependent helicase HrpB [Pseudoalteromonas sp. SR43-6]|uniref:ATP-dependent helicase HrpB n=1 Tax=unclassified Pseudoalteromonas TaxID=194690 RepID=UPI0015FC6C17|nr:MULTISPECIES: ATP-dependent helicase HrpB [unclassified Pseudoalteromonas]MBB1289513.1 ATP-dependent helicase HrpB [Pseudoalteromonas sp. SR41-5]MBB1374966.1 ATP-dependent helicase HrpB [Pseudoalteromonas sp. SR43-6]MBB1414023.1 ATP-dependent helicase HrpB [Pseudoalteromonas sp. SG43-8]
MLPVQDIYQQLVTTLQSNPITLLQAPPGAGKSTWLPLELMRDGHFKRIVMLEPRRLAARNIASYLAKCQNESVGQSVGLRIRGESKVSANTRLEIVTEGMLTRMLQNDPELSDIDLLIFDEFHERSIAADTSLAFALETQSALREDLTIMLMSATLDTERYTAFFDCPVIQSSGRSYPIDEVYIPIKDESRWLDAIPNIIKQALNEQTGSALVFLPGQFEILRVQQALTDLPSNCQVATLFGEQDKANQQTAIAPALNGMRKVVLTTNVAETSLTIEGIRIVIDSGKRRAATFNLKTGVTELTTQSISSSSAVQRAGRAGRIEPGIVYRIGSKQTFERRNSHDNPEILTSDISQLMLEAKQWGASIDELTLLDKPTEQQCEQASNLLNMLEAIDSKGKLTPLGSKMLGFGADIRLAHMLLKAQILDDQLPGIFRLAIYLVALLESRVNSANELSLALHSQQQRPHPVFKQQLKYWQSRLKVKDENSELNTHYISLLVALAYPDRIAKKRGNGYLLANGAGAELNVDYWHNDDYLAIATMGGHKGGRIFAATALNPFELQEFLPHLFSKLTRCEFDEKSARFIHQDEVKLGAITLSSQPSKQKLDKSERAKAWLSLFTKHGFALFNEQPDAQQLLIRMSLASNLMPDKFPQINEQQLIQNAAQWLGVFLEDIKTLTQLKKFNYFEALQNCFDWQQQTALKALLPLRLTVPSGSNIKIEYQLDGPAKLSVRMQEVYGLTSTPMLANGKLPLLMELLSPGKRSLQLTQDLAHFWDSSYRDVQKEMKGRYPKHFWPDDPANSVATNRVKSKM